MSSNWEDETTWDDEFFSCSACGTTECVAPHGSPSSPVLLIGSYPGEDEIKDGFPFTGKTGGVLKAELRKVGLNYDEFRTINLWKHIPNKRDDCREDGIKSAVAEAVGKKIILLIGAEAVKYFCDASVEAHNGLLLKSKYLSAPYIMACLQPTTVFHGSLGDFRLTIQKFAKLVDKVIK